MKNKGAIIVLTLIGLVALLGSGPCDEAQLDDDLSPLTQYESRLFKAGSVVNVFEKLAYDTGVELAPNGFFVMLNRIDDPVGPVLTPIPGIAEGFDFSVCPSSGYVLALVISNLGGSAFDLAGTAGWVNIRFGGVDHQVQVPQGAAGFIEGGQALVLYIASNGSTYYAINDDVTPDTNIFTHDIADGTCDFAGTGCPTLRPGEAYSPANLAAGTGSGTPLMLYGNTIDAANGLNGGLLADITSSIQIIVLGIDVCPPNLGYDQPNDTTDFGLGGYDTAFAYRPITTNLLDTNPQPWYYPNGVVFTPNNGAVCDLNPNASYEMTLYLQNKFGEWFNVADPTIIPFTTGPAPAGYALNLCAP